MSSASAVAVTASPSGGTSTFRPDIEGLRALAVLLVLGSHLLGWPSGGFVGVDVFFVVSGFLITGLLVREHERSGRLSLREFYVRRIRRLVPAAVLVLVVTNLAASVLFLGARAQQTLTDSVWAFGFLANVRFALLGTDYFELTRPPSPVQHYWTLSVEEQFYVVWPALLLAGLTLAARRRAAPRRVVAGLLVVLVTLSFAWSVHATTVSATTAYFSTPARAWELGVGALVALGAARLARVPAALRAALAWLGVGGIVASAFVIGPATPFPGTAALLPVLSTAAVVAAGAPRGGPRWLELGPVRYVGRLSYSLYLWHWPVLVMLPLLMPAGAPTTLAAAAALTLVLSVASHHMVEEPVRRSSWLDPRPPQARVPLLARVSAGVVTVALLAGGVGIALTGPGRTDEAAELAPLSAEELAVVLPRELRRGVERERWPDRLRPGLDVLPDSGAPEWREDSCLDVGPRNREQCVYGRDDAVRDAALLGDSIAVSWVPALRQVLEPQGFRLHVLTLRQCPNAAVLTYTQDPDVPNRGCEAHREWALAEVRALQPDLVLMSNSPEPLSRLVGDREPADWTAGLAATLSRVTPYAGRTIVLAPPPRSGNLQSCATRVSAPRDCAAPLEEPWTALDAVQRPAVERSRADYLDLLDLFCVDERCPAVVGRTPVHFDGSHLTADYARFVAPLLGRALEDLGVW